MIKQRIAIDAMGGDHGPSVTVPASIDAIKAHPQLQITLVGDQAVLEKHCKEHKLSAELSKRLLVHHASEQVAMDELPTSALRFKKDSSMRVAVNLVKEGKADACVSAGNTGALMATAKFVLKTLPGIDRPAIVYSIPTANDDLKLGHLRMLDLGANVDCGPEHLYQFAVMGSVLSQTVDQHPHPRVGLLNIGSESIKGSEPVKQAAKLLASSKALNYIGYVEGTDIFQNKCDVVVCDGFVGNIALKSSEGVASMLLALIKKEFSRNLWTKLAALVIRPIIKKVLKHIDPKHYNGATFLGLNGTVIKSHGNAQRAGFKVAIEEAITEATFNVPERIRSEVVLNLGEQKSA